MENNLDPKEFVKRLKKNGKKEETNLQRKIQEYLVSKGAYEFKVHGSTYMKAGIPDIISCYKGSDLYVLPGVYSFYFFQSYIRFQ